MADAKGPIRVLIANGEEEVRRLLALTIEEDAGLQLVGTAPDAAEAIRLAELNKPDVAVLDWTITGGGGHAAKMISERSPATRLIAFTATDSLDASYEMLHSGAVGLLAKDAPPEKLLETIHSVVHW